MLSYENQIMLDVIHEDGLVIAAKGLGLERVFVSILKVYSDPGNLVLVLGTSSKEEEYFISQLESLDVKPLPKVITSELSVNERQLVYLDGGVIFASSRILVTDFLLNRIPSEHITGILVYKAHKVVESGQEAFILRLFRIRNKTGFIKAFSSSPVSFTAGFCHVNRVMRSLFVRNLYLWPRFHKDVSDCLNQCKPEVIELQLKQTPAMLSIQTACLDLIHYSTKELKKTNPSLDLEDISVEAALSKSFHKILQLQLEPVWHQLSSKTRQLVADLKTLRTILVSLTQYDCITFYNIVSSLRKAENAIRNSGWLLLPSFDTLYLQAKIRVFGESDQDEPELEENPKWTALGDVLKEVRDEDKEKREEERCRVLIVAENERTCNQIKEFLDVGARNLLMRLFKKVFLKKQSNKNNEKEETVSNPRLIVHPLQVIADPFALTKLLYTYKPDTIIMYDADLSFVRQVEVYQATNCEIPVRVYFMIYNGSSEEQSYLTTLRREKEAYEMLIKEKATMVVPEEREGRTELNQDLMRDPRKASEQLGWGSSAGTRQGGGPEATEQPLVVVDMREFRSELPALIHRRGMDIYPITIEIGDYILTPNICVERKSLSDLIGSLQSGRLYNQAQAMCRYYSKPILLIEFEHGKPFALRGQYFFSSDSSYKTQDITARLQLLTLHFPKLKIIWSPSPYATAEIFEELKKKRPQPTPEAAASITSENQPEFSTERFNSSLHDFLLKLPGVTHKNVFALLNNVKNLAELCSLSQEEISELLKNSFQGKSLFDALHSPLTSESGASSSGKGSKRFGDKKGRWNTKKARS
ncbi:DNA repair endonuclease XPF-like [Artemia franciscana]|uniref:DNA repair endonuclease XPF-like n=1 Tax=Artemia franciscana TaxID=6661 RepID=UPI0032D9B3EA